VEAEVHVGVSPLADLLANLIVREVVIVREYDVLNHFRWFLGRLL